MKKHATDPIAFAQRLAPSPMNPCRSLMTRNQIQTNTVPAHSRASQLRRPADKTADKAPRCRLPSPPSGYWSSARDAAAATI